mmetsp:Transcript_1374/g.2847  ORF Transcript_1374/g.2847 Transcript_1374/m.2847 type:complete len:126 (+) Transcript_1374:130-507(+)
MSAKTRAAAILDVPHNATRTQVKEAYRKLALQHHPDRNPNAAQEFSRITDAYKTLMASEQITSSAQHINSTQHRAYKQVYRPGNFRVLLGCGIGVVGGFALFGGAWLLHEKYRLYEEQMVLQTNE